MMFQVQNLTITHKKDLRNLIEDFSFVLRPGDKTALIGEEGNGKSTLLKLLHDERLAEPYVRCMNIFQGIRFFTTGRRGNWQGWEEILAFPQISSIRIRRLQPYPAEKR